MHDLVYSRAIIDRNLAKIQASLNLDIKYHSQSFISQAIDALSTLPAETNKYGRPSKGDEGPFRRPLTQEEWSFINNERLLCKYDFLHYFLNYCSTKIIRTGEPIKITKVGKLLESQEILHRRIAAREDAIYAAVSRNEPVDGILFAMAKARQLGATSYGRGAVTHRTLFWDDTAAFSASVDEEMTHTLYERDHDEIYMNLPWWLKPEIQYDTKDQHIRFGRLNSSITYGQANQKGGMGTGKGGITVVHLTELGLWQYQGGEDSVRKIALDLEPAIPLHPSVLFFKESTAYLRNNYWHKFVTASQSGETRFTVWFCPWYAEGKYVAQPPASWEPAAVTKAMAVNVEKTSHDYLDRVVRLTPQQMYYWERGYKEAFRDGTLGDFLSNYPSTLEESFQHSGSKAFNVAALQLLRSRLGVGIPYEVLTV